MFEQKHKSTKLQAAFTLFKVFVGTGVMALPHAFHDIGLGLGMIAMATIATMVYTCIKMVVEVSTDHR
eukprot:CAMPEP_0114577534 /NCGR_PEP_ID=MMETSP0125-20121206/2185_1 /TAXON_ID=485358 ORGANISM="Aristerostoma sp., Strain ATCC 50986" /NCGR_SAMPLE_ID=MMETSP0125 /ASSEMBLY_ACC=CAM_ASM_000245 /LENGTH=67 /DNA_ID=CAMNT_0001766923 /DNA_START=44 /DNA_END=247 /DNA_ORIENTATION=+